MTYDLSTIGEGQIRLTVNQGERLSQARSLRMTAACSEANVAGFLAQVGHRTSWSSIMPKGDLSKRVLDEFRAVDVDLSHMVMRDEGRVALYFMEPGEFPMPGTVTYDRLHTPFREAEVEDFDWEALLDTKIAFVTGVTAALTAKTARVVRHFVDQARERDIDVALDINYRSRLWSPADAREVLSPLAAKATMLFCSRRDARTIFGITGSGPEVCAQLRGELGASHVVSTDQVDGIYVSSSTLGDHTFEVNRVPVIDRPGAGDAFVAGALHGYLHGDLLRGVVYGRRAAVYALTHHGDLTHISPAELDDVESSDILR